MKKSEIRPEIVEMIELLRKRQHISFWLACLQIINTTRRIKHDHYNKGAKAKGE